MFELYYQIEFNFMFAHFSSPEPSFSLNLEPLLSPQMTAERTELACHVTNITHLPLGGRLGINWEHTSLPGTFISAKIINVIFYRILLNFDLSNHLQVLATNLRPRIPLAPWMAKATCCQDRCILTG